MQTTRFDFEAIGTHWQIDIQGQLSPVERSALLDILLSRIDDFDKTYSRFRADSLITAISKQNGEYTFPADAEKLFSLYKLLYDVSGGSFTPLIGQVLV